MTIRKTLLAAAAVVGLTGAGKAPPEPMHLAQLGKVATVEPRFLSYNVEMVEVTGGRFWRPYGSPGADRFEYRPPIDLTNPRLRRFASALGPAYVRVSGTWANATWFSDTEEAPVKAPEGFDTVLTRRQWRGVVEFARASDAQIVTSFATSPGARTADGVWQPEQAAKWLAYTRRIGGKFAAAEFANEPNMLWLTKPPANYAGADYRRDYARFAGWLRQASPGTLLLAPGLAEIGEPFRTLNQGDKSRPMLEGSELITAQSPRPDRFSFHFYAGASQRCGKIPGFDLSTALKPTWLNSIDVAIARVVELRNATAPGVPMWDTETGETACGGNPWAAGFADTFRFTDTLGRSARAGVTVFMHNTLAASDYGLLDEHDYTPRPNYWAALLWKRTMGSTVLAPPQSSSPELRLYAHCLYKRPGGVGLLAINTGAAPQTLGVGRGAMSWTMTGQPLETRTITINGHVPGLDPKGNLTGLQGAPVTGSLTVPAQSIAFVAVPRAGNRACR